MFRFFFFFLESPKLGVGWDICNMKLSRLPKMEVDWHSGAAWNELRTYKVIYFITFADLVSIWKPFPVFSSKFGHLDSSHPDIHASMHPCTHSHWIPIGFSLDSHWIPIGFSFDSHWFLIGFPLDAHWILTGFPLDSHWILSGFPLDSYCTLTP